MKFLWQLSWAVMTCAKLWHVCMIGIELQKWFSQDFSYELHWVSECLTINNRPFSQHVELITRIYPMHFSYSKAAFKIPDDVIKWKHFPRYWPFVRGIHQSLVNSPHKGQWRRALMFSLICDWTNDWANNRGGGDLRRHRAHYDVTVFRRGKLSVLFRPQRVATDHPSLDVDLLATYRWYIGHMIVSTRSLSCLSRFDLYNYQPLSCWI